MSNNSRSDRAQSQNDDIPLNSSVEEDDEDSESEEAPDVQKIHFN